MSSTIRLPSPEHKVFFYWEDFIPPFAKSSWEVAGSLGEEHAILNPIEFS